MSKVMKWLLVSVILASGAGCVHTSAGKPAGTSPGQLCISPSYFGITVGKTSDDQVVLLHGTGLYKEDGDGRWRRYYHDSSRSLLLVSHAGLDGIINSLTVSVQQDTAEYDFATIGVSSKLRAHQGIADTKVRLGSTHEEVRKAFGKGKADENPVVSLYEIDCPNSGSRQPVELVLVFEGDRIVSISFSERPTS